MEIATETNKVLDKLAEILGATGSDIVDAYTEAFSKLSSSDKQAAKKESE